jgi:succinoglycan biosynthesis protein ExoM
MNGKTIVCMGVCTLQRPTMLARCLASLAAQKCPDGVELHIIVVDKDAAPTSRPIVDNFLPSSPYPVH